MGGERKFARLDLGERQVSSANRGLFLGGYMQTVTYRLTVADLVDAGGYAYNRLLAVRAIRLSAFILTLVWVLNGAYQAFQRDWNGLGVQSIWIFVGSALIAWMYVGNRWLMPSAIRKQVASSKGLQDDIVANWDEERFALDTNHGQARYPWTDFYKWQESAGSLLLWQSNRSYFCLPKRAFTDNQISEIRANLTRAVGRPGKRRK
jgi:hypothetical protein